MAKTYGSISPILTEHPHEVSPPPELRDAVEQQTQPKVAQAEAINEKDVLVEISSEEDAQQESDPDEGGDGNDDDDSDELDSSVFEDALDQAEDLPCYDQGDHQISLST